MPTLSLPSKTFHVSVPSIVELTSLKASQRFVEFFVATIRNTNTREAYFRAYSRFLSWCENYQIRSLSEIKPIHVAAYIEILGRDFQKATVKQHLAAIRVVFDWLVTGQIVEINPATSVRGPKLDFVRGLTPVLAPADVRRLLDHIEIAHIAGRRDRALISLMVFAFARVSAAVSMSVSDYFFVGETRWVRLREKGGKRHEMPAHQELVVNLDAYLRIAGISADTSSPLLRAIEPGGTLTSRSMTRSDAYRMVRSRAKDACLNVAVCCHSFRATGITAYLNNGGTLENAQRMAAHESPRTTKLYDRTGDNIALEEIERIRF